MLAYVQAFINIALLKSAPEDLPDSRFLLGLTLFVYIVTQIPLGPAEVLVRAVSVSLLMLFGGMWALLHLTGHGARYTRAITAMLGVNALLSALSVPFSLWSQSATGAEMSAATPNTVIFAIMLWSIAIDGHILARVLSRPYGIGLLVAVGFFFLHTAVLFELLPAGTGNQAE